MIADILACPRCDSPLRMVDHLWECDSCGTVARQRRDIIDFLFDTSVIRLANEGRWDLEEDQRIGLQLLEVLDECTYEDLSERAIRLRSDSNEFVSDPGAQLRTSRLALRAQQRFARRYERVAGEVGRGHGHQMLHKIETRLQDLRKSPMPRQLAIEVGGGDGQYLLGFANRFQHVVFVDGSLVNVILATALGRDDGVTNVSFPHADITTLPIRSSVASLVHANNVIEHVHRPYEMTSECVRVTSGGGYAVVVSPNRNSIFPEPHFRLPLYGLIPRPLRLWLIPFTRGKRSETGTNPLSLRGLRNTLEKAPPSREWDVFVAPRGLVSTARQTPIRRAIAGAFRSPVGHMADWMVNRVLLAIAPCHIAMVKKTARDR